MDKNKLDLIRELIKNYELNQKIIEKINQGWAIIVGDDISINKNHRLYDKLSVVLINELNFLNKSIEEKLEKIL